MPIQLLGNPLLERDATGRLTSRVGTLFLHTPGLVTLPGIHATQRLAWIDHLSAARIRQALPPLDDVETAIEMEESVDLLMNEQFVLIRPDPARMDLAFRCDDLLQTLVSKRQIRFLNVTHERVRQALRARGEYWRMSPLPRSPGEIEQVIADSRVAIGGTPIYYYNKDTGTRFLTCEAFDWIETLADDALRFHLLEIQQCSGRRNRFGNPEIDFFPPGSRFGRTDIAEVDFANLPPASLRQMHRELVARFRAGVPADFGHDRIDNIEWRNAMCAALVNQPNATMTMDIVHGLSPEFFLQIEWLPGARIEDGELIFDPIFDEQESRRDDAGLADLCDQRARGFIFNYVREFGDIEYVNIGRINRTLSMRSKDISRSTVYIAEVKERRSPEPVVRIIRLQKWGISEHLKEGKSLLQAILESEDYTDYILDRRLGCQQLGMNLPAHVTSRRISETYTSTRPELWGQIYWTSYLERDYVEGHASDKLSEQNYLNPEFNRRLARLLGEAAAVNLIVGRTPVTGGHILFDDGDEVIVLDVNGLPSRLVVSDHTGAFNSYREPLCTWAGFYADPVRKRSRCMFNAAEFAEIYLISLEARFRHIRNEYFRRKRAFDTLFRHRRRDEAGSFAFRWECVLQRLAQTEPGELARCIRAQL
jgi:hypothetical protein